jgi:hypothetical protein
MKKMLTSTNLIVFNERPSFIRFIRLKITTPKHVFHDFDVYN